MRLGELAFGLVGWMGVAPCHAGENVCWYWVMREVVVKGYMSEREERTILLGNDLKQSPT